MQNIYPDLDDETKEILSEKAREVEITFWRGSFEKAHRIVDDAQQVRARAEQRQKAALDDPLSALSIPLRMVNALWDAGIQNVEDLLRMNVASFEAIPGFGGQSWHIVSEALQRHGYTHGGNDERIRVLAQTGFRIPGDKPDSASANGHCAVDHQPTTERKPMTTIDEAIDLLSSEDAAPKIQQRIDALEAELAKLKKFQKVLGIQKAKRQFTVDENVEQKIVDYLKGAGPQAPGTISKKLGLAPINVGKIVSGSKRLQKVGRFVEPLTN